MKPLLRVLMYLLVLILLGGAIWYEHTQVVALWQDVALRQATLQDVPTETSRTADLKKQLDAARLKMDVLEKTLPTNDQIVDVVAAISQAVTLSGVSAQVPIVEEENPEAAEADTTKLFTDVRIHVVASGSPAELADFVYRLEHLPYMVHLASWEIDSLRQTAVTPFAGATPPPSATASTPSLASSLEADLDVVTRRNDTIQE